MGVAVVVVVIVLGIHNYLLGPEGRSMGYPPSSDWKVKHYFHGRDFCDG
ncbi:hypothetical protein CUJ84_pRLN2000012 (plasmid) [Rhizobium leguminosarum]|uniref:Uncharacterized protein n=1 Tax=Rhizobium leguminosarum TaxID=384 RepID=A0A2K9ZE92_RHILE|nr:hypothetical protein CUJ84_pRLN2000012 [Rhizobium leguminosarum]